MIEETRALFGDGLFKGLSRDDIKTVTDHCRRQKYPGETVLFREQTRASTLYLVIEGAIDLRFEMPARKNAQTTITTSGPGMTVGWSSIVPPHVYRLSGYTHGATEVFEIDRETLDSLCTKDYRLGYQLMRNIAELAGQRLYQVQDKLAKVLGEEAIHGW